jgi:hypothetical protein
LRALCKTLVKDKRFRARRTKLERAMRPPRVVAHGAQGKHPAEMRLS